MCVISTWFCREVTENHVTSCCSVLASVNRLMALSWARTQNTFYCQLTSDSYILPSQPDHHETLDTAEFVSEKCSNRMICCDFHSMTASLIDNCVFFNAALVICTDNNSKTFFCKLQMKEWCNKWHIVWNIFSTTRFQLPTRLYIFKSYPWNIKTVQEALLTRSSRPILQTHRANGHYHHNNAHFLVYLEFCAK